jgi:hypothetical protein
VPYTLFVLLDCIQITFFCAFGPAAFRVVLHAVRALQLESAFVKFILLEFLFLPACLPVAFFSSFFVTMLITWIRRSNTVHFDDICACAC